MNYRRTHPKRRDGWKLACRVAMVHADRLREPEVAREVLDAALRDCTNDELAAELKRLRQRLDAGLPLRSIVASRDDENA